MALEIQSGRTMTESSWSESYTAVVADLGLDFDTGLGVLLLAERLVGALVCTNCGGEVMPWPTPDPDSGDLAWRGGGGGGNGTAARAGGGYVIMA